MKFKPTLITLAVAALATSVQAQVLTKEFYNVKGALNTTMYNAYTGTGVTLTWGRGFTGLGVKVAVLDSGFDLSHSDLKGQVIAAKNFSDVVVENTKTNPNNFKANIQVGTDITWSLHGTQMASIVAGKSDGNGAVGVAPDARLLLAQVGQGVTYNSTTKTWTYSGTGISTPALINALTWAEANGATVANMSLGSSYATDKAFLKGVTLLSPGLYKAPATHGSMYGRSTTDLMTFAGASKTMALVASAGNDGLPYAQFPGAYATQVDSKGNLVLGGRMLIVGSVGDNNVISGFSNRAGSFCTNLVGTTCKDPYYVKDFFVVAPGEGIISSIANQAKTGNTGNAVSGTSPAAAFVSGGIALMKQAWPQLSGAQLVNLVKTTATDLGAKGVDEVYGYGLVNFNKATLPTGTVTYTTSSLSSSSVTTGSSVVNVSISATGSIGNVIKTSSVLSNVQVVDNINRNYTADFTRAVGNSNPVNSLAMSPYLAMQGTGYREFSVPFGNVNTMSFMQSSNGVAAQYETAYNDTKVSLQLGSMSEANGFLNNYGTGLTSFGNSGTTWALVGSEKDIGANFSVLGNYGVGITKTGSVQNSMIALSPTLVSDTWKLGIAKNNIFFSGKTNDKLSLSVQGPVAVRRGHADVTAVTGYNYTTDAEDNTTATPISSSERMNLASGKRETNLILGYNVQVQNQTYVGFAVGRQFNANGVNANTVAFTARSVF
jgi:subtilisin family serine protease